MPSPVHARTPVPPVWDASMLPDLSGKIALVMDAGTESGVGFHTALQLALRGAHVELALNPQQHGTEDVATIETMLQDAPVTGGCCEVSHVDVSSLASVAAFVERFKQIHDRLDILINASISVVPAFSETDEGLELHVVSNYVSHFALVAGLMELLQKCPDQARVVSTSSALHKRASFNDSDLVVKRRGRVAFSPLQMYAKTSLYKLIFAQELQRRLDNAGVKSVISVAANPGAMSRGVKKHDFSQLGLTFQLAIKYEQSPEMGALSILYAAAATGVQSGDYYGPDGPLGISGYPGHQVPSAFAQSEEYGQELWTISEEMAKKLINF